MVREGSGTINVYCLNGLQTGHQVVTGPFLLLEGPTSKRLRLFTLFASLFAVILHNNPYLWNSEVLGPWFWSWPATGVAQTITMGLFRKAKKSGQTSPLGPASRALSDLVSLIGEWTGEAIDWDPDWEQSHRRPMGVGFELDEDGRHLVIHYWANHGGPVMRSFDVLGVDSSGEELLRTHFVGRNRQTHHFRILDHKKNGRGRDFSLSLETTAWDEARPCEIRWEIHRRGDALEMKTSRCLIGMSDDFVQTSTFTLSRI